MIEKQYEERTVFGSPEEQKEQIEKLQKEGWVVVGEVGYNIPFGIDMVAEGILMQREIEN